jgi:hypothetical protein
MARWDIKGKSQNNCFIAFWAVRLGIGSIVAAGLLWVKNIS